MEGFNGSLFGEVINNRNMWIALKFSRKTKIITLNKNDYENVVVKWCSKNEVTFREIELEDLRNIKLLAHVVKKMFLNR